MTQQQQDQNPPEKRFDDHSVIVPPHKLKKAVTHMRGPVQIDMSAVDRAEAALAELKVEFGEWMNAECARIDAARRVIHAKGLSRVTADALFLPAHDIKGGAATLGFPIAERIATSLCRLLQHAPEVVRIPRSFIDLHVDAIRAIVREDVKDAHNPYGLELSERLSIMVETFLAEELKDAYAEIAGDAAPRIALPEKN
jgi:chemotaxis protein histidine kinase CheA